MIHSDDHDPILGSEWAEGCAACLAARNAAFAQLRKVTGGLGPYDTDEFVARMQDEAYLQLARLDVPIRIHVQPKIYDWAERGDFG